jgi:hypothetical protein
VTARAPRILSETRGCKSPSGLKTHPARRQYFSSPPSRSRHSASWAARFRPADFRPCDPSGFLAARFRCQPGRVSGLTMWATSREGALLLRFPLLDSPFGALLSSTSGEN